MNIFVLDLDPRKCAEYHSNRHVVKMCIEYAQLLCGAHWMTEGGQYEIPYKLSHKNHPCAIWTRKSLSNYQYLCELGLELCYEYTYRYGKRHKSQDIIEWCRGNLPNIEDRGVTTPALAMPDHYKEKDPISSYRRYYIEDKSSFAHWKNRETPEWFLKGK